jgi:hypothetical protein
LCGDREDEAAALGDATAALSLAGLGPSEGGSCGVRRIKDDALRRGVLLWGVVAVVVVVEAAAAVVAGGPPMPAPIGAGEAVVTRDARTTGPADAELSGRITTSPPPKFRGDSDECSSTSGATGSALTMAGYSAVSRWRV